MHPASFNYEQYLIIKEETKNLQNQELNKSKLNK